MPAYTSFVVAGAGNLGSHLAHALLKQGFKVTALSRSSTGAKVESLAAAGATIAAVDYDDASSIEKAVSGSQVVINTLSPEAMQGTASDTLIEQSKKAGVQPYVPNDWGFDYAFSASKGMQPHPISLKKAGLGAELEKVSHEPKAWLTTAY